MELEVDAERKENVRLGYLPVTGIHVRAKYHDEWTTADISTLTRISLIAWLRDHESKFVESVILILLGHSDSDTLDKASPT